MEACKRDNSRNINDFVASYRHLLTFEYFLMENSIRLLGLSDILLKFIRGKNVELLIKCYIQRGYFFCISSKKYLSLDVCFSSLYTMIRAYTSVSI